MPMPKLSAERLEEIVTVHSVTDDRVRKSRRAAFKNAPRLNCVSVVMVDGYAVHNEHGLPVQCADFPNLVAAYGAILRAQKVKANA